MQTKKHLSVGTKKQNDTSKCYPLKKNVAKREMADCRLALKMCASTAIKEIMSLIVRIRKMMEDGCNQKML